MRWTPRVCFALGFALLVGAQLLVARESVAASQTGESSEPTKSLLPTPPKIRRDLYSRLFQVPDLETQTPTPSISVATPPPNMKQPRVVCGMTVIPADPSIDPEMSADPRRSDTQYSMRTMQPPVCK